MFRSISEAGFTPRHWTANDIANLTPDQLRGMILPSKPTRGRVRLSEHQVTPEFIGKLEEEWRRENSPEAKRAKALAALDREMRRQGL